MDLTARTKLLVADSEMPSTPPGSILPKILKLKVPFRWSFLEIETMPEFDTDLQAYAAGVLEGC